MRIGLAPDFIRVSNEAERKPDAWYATRRWYRVDFSDIPEVFGNNSRQEQRDALVARLQKEDPNLS